MVGSLMMASNTCSSSIPAHTNLVTGRRYPSPLVKQELAKLGKDGETRRSALASLKSIVEEHLYDASITNNNVAKFLQQVEESREGRHHVVAIVEILAKIRGPALAPHVPRLMHLLVQYGLLASTGCPALLPACASCVCMLAASVLPGTGEAEGTHSSSRVLLQEVSSGPQSGTMTVFDGQHVETTPNPTMPTRMVSGHCESEALLRQICLPLLSLLPNKIPPLASGAATCLRSLVDTSTWRSWAPHILVEELCYKAALAAATSPPTTQTTISHLLLLRSLASTNPSAITKLAPPLIRLSIGILLPHPFSATSAAWQLRIAAIQLLEVLLIKASDYALLSDHLRPSLAALEKCRRHDKLPQVRNAVIHSIHTLQTLQEQHSLIGTTSVATHSSHNYHATASNSSIIEAGKFPNYAKFTDLPPVNDRILKLNRAHKVLNTHPAATPQILNSPLASPRKMQDQNISLESSVKPLVALTRPSVVSDNKLTLDEVPGINESEFFLSYFREVDDIHQQHDDIADVINPCRPSLSNTTTSQCRQRKVVHHISEAASLPEAAGECSLNSTTKLEWHLFGDQIRQPIVGIKDNLEAKFINAISHEPSSSDSNVSSLMAAALAATTATTYKRARDITVFGSDNEDLATCEKNPCNNNKISTTGTHMEQQPLMMMKYRQYGGSNSSGSNDISTMNESKSGSQTDQNNTFSNNTVRGQSAEAHYNAAATDDDDGRVCSPRLILSSKDDQVMANDKNALMSPCIKPSNTGHGDHTLMSPRMKPSNASHGDHASMSPCMKPSNATHGDHALMSPCIKPSNASHDDHASMSPCMKPSNASHGDHASMSPCMKPSNVSHGDHASMSPCMKPSNAGHDDHLTHMSPCKKPSSASHNDHTTNASSSGGMMSHDDGDVILVNYTKTVDADNDDKVGTSLLCGDSTLFHFNLDATTLHEGPAITDVKENHEKIGLPSGSKDVLEEDVSLMMNTDLTTVQENTSEAETANGEWSVIDNPIAEDHVISMSEENTTCNRRSSELIHALRWSMPQIPCIDLRRELRDRERRLSEVTHVRKEEINLDAIRITCNEELLDAVGHDNELFQQSRSNKPYIGNPHISDECSWIEIEELSPILENENLFLASSCELPCYISHKTKSISHRIVDKQLRPSKVLVCFGLFFPIAITILSRFSPHKDDVGHFLPPT